MTKEASMLNSIYHGMSFEDWMEKDAAWNPMHRPKGRTLDFRPSGAGITTMNAKGGRGAYNSGGKGALSAAHAAKLDAHMELGKNQVLTRDTDGSALKLKGVPRNPKEQKALAEGAAAYERGRQAAATQPSKWEQMQAAYNQAKQNGTRVIGRTKIVGGDIESYKRQGILDSNGRFNNPFENNKGTGVINYNNIGYGEGDISTNNPFIGNFRFGAHSQKSLEGMEAAIRNRNTFDDPSRFKLTGDNLQKLSRIQPETALEKFAMIMLSNRY